MQHINVRILPGTHLYTWVESSNVDKVSFWRTKSARHWRESNPEPFDPESRVQSNIPRHLREQWSLLFFFVQAKSNNKPWICHNINKQTHIIQKNVNIHAGVYTGRGGGGRLLLFFLLLLLVREVGDDVWCVPLLRVWKIDPTSLRRKKATESPPPPPPPPPLHKSCVRHCMHTWREKHNTCIQNTRIVRNLTRTDVDNHTLAQWRSQDLILGGAVKNNVRGSEATEPERADRARGGGGGGWDGGVFAFWCC